MVLWGFRGQADATWDLDTTLNRTAKTFGYPAELLWQREYWMLRQFQRRAHHYCKDLPGFEQKLDWLALMQHYGAPTRLLDFSHSFYVAAYFALENASKDSAVWAIDLDALRNSIAQKTGVSTLSENTDMTNQRHVGIANEHISINAQKSEIKYSLVANVEPERLHERLLIQQGFFLFPSDIGNSFQDVLLSTLNIHPVASDEENEFLWDGHRRTLEKDTHPLIKIILPEKIRFKAIESLYNMNITAATLFPGLDGFAKSMKYHITTWPGKREIEND